MTLYIGAPSGWLFLLPVLCGVHSEDTESESVTVPDTTKIRPAYLKRFEHKLNWGPDIPVNPNATTIYVEPEFKRCE